MLDWLFLLLLGLSFGSSLPGQSAASAPVPHSELDRMAVAIEGVESRYGVDQSMWRTNAAGPQGPMQVSAAAATDVGGGDRFQLDENRAIGRAYLARLFAHYKNWADAVAAYSAGPANVDAWIAQGRPDNTLAARLSLYLDRIRKGLLALSPPPAPAPAPTPVSIAAAPVIEIRDARLRKKYLSDRAAIVQLQRFLDAASPPESEADTAAVLATIRVVAARPGYSEFANTRSTSALRPSQATLKQIAQVLIGKLQMECDAIVLVDDRKHSQHP